MLCTPMTTNHVDPRKTSEHETISEYIINLCPGWLNDQVLLYLIFVRLRWLGWIATAVMAVMVVAMLATI